SRAWPICTGISTATQSTPEAANSAMPQVNHMTWACGVVMTDPLTTSSVAPVAVNATSVTVGMRCAQPITMGSAVRSAKVFHSAVTTMLPRKTTAPNTCRTFNSSYDMAEMGSTGYPE